MSETRYGQFCPVAMAAEILCTRWTMVVLRELVAGSTRFNDLRRGVPKMSPTLLSKRLGELEAAGIVEREPARDAPANSAYVLTEAGRDLAPLVEGFGRWGQRWLQTAPSLDNADAGLLMWDMRRNLDPRPMPEARSVIEFDYCDQPETCRHWWLIVEPGEAIDLCAFDPGFEVDLLVETDLRCMTRIWMGLMSVRRAEDKDRLALSGDPEIAGHMQRWLGLSPFADEPKRAGKAGSGGAA